METKEFLKSRKAADSLVCVLAFAAIVFCSLPAWATVSTAADGGQSQTPQGDFQKRDGQTPPLVRDGKLAKLSHYEPTRMLRLAFALIPPHLEEEHQFLDDIQNRNSPLFHKFLTADEWNARFAPSVEDEQAVVDWVKSQGLTITHRYPNRLLVDVEAPAGTIEKALGIEINNYQIGEDIRFANDRDPVFPANLNAIVQSVQGLNSFESVRAGVDRDGTVRAPDYVPGPVVAQGESLQRDALRKSSPSADKADLQPRPELSTSYGFQPADIYGSETYDYGALMNLGHCCNPDHNSTGSPPESSIAVAAFANLAMSDVTEFQATFPNLAVNVNAIAIDGTYTCNNTPNVDPNCLEVTMDTEWSLTTANSLGSYLDTAHVYVYEGANYNNGTVIDVYNQILNDGLTRVLTTSWYCAENLSYSTKGDCYNATMVARDNVFSQLIGEGWTLINASGDEGATAAYCTDALGVMFPASDPNFVAAGGTLLTPYTDGTFASEVAWTGGTATGSCLKNNGGSTGGFSNYWNAPSYQTDYFSSYTKRATPDLALNAAFAQEIYFNGSLTGVGGTSIVAPELAGFFAQENAYLLSLGSICGSNGITDCWPLGNPNYALYLAANSRDGAHYPFYDVTSGCNSNDITALYKLTAYCAGTGFDQVTGWGSANMLQLAWALNFNTSYARGDPYVTFSGPAANKWYNSEQLLNFTINDFAGTGTNVPGTGIAGFTQTWDSIPNDPASEAHGGTGNSFYSGPEFPNTSTGCLALGGTSGCQTVSTQGCHTAYVHGWNNEGLTTAGQTAFPESYGPLCFDNVPPTASASVSPTPTPQGWNNAPVTVTLSATDPGGAAASGVSKIYFGINDQCTPGGPVANCGVYSAPFTENKDGIYTIVYYSVDVAGNVSTNPFSYIRVMLDQTPPVTTAQFFGTLTGGVYYSPVNITMQVTDNLSDALDTEYQIDGGTIYYYDTGATPPNKIPVTTPGSHTFKYWSTDLAGNVETAHTTTFKIAGFPSTMSTPAPGAVLGTSSVPFTWTPGTGATQYQLWLGLSGPGSSSLYTSGWLTTTSTTVPSLPAKGATVYARLYSTIGGVNVYNDYTFTESAPAGTPAIMNTPTAGSTLGTSNVQFTWTMGGDVTQYQLWLGLNGAGSSGLYTSGWLTTTFTTVPSLPAKGATVYARLYSTINGKNQYIDYTYTESVPPGTPATMSTPTSGSTLGTSNVQFTWTPGTGVTQYQLWLGLSGPGSSSLYTSGWLTTTSTTVASLPAKGATVYARLYSTIGGKNQYVDYTYVEAP